MLKRDRLAARRAFFLALPREPPDLRKKTSGLVRECRWRSVLPREGRTNDIAVAPHAVARPALPEDGVSDFQEERHDGIERVRREAGRIGRARGDARRAGD